MNYVELYYGKEVLDWYDNTMKLPNAISLRPSASFSARSELMMVTLTFSTFGSIACMTHWLNEWLEIEQLLLEIKMSADSWPSWEQQLRSIEWNLNIEHHWLPEIDLFDILTRHVLRLLASPVHISVGGLSLEDATSVSTDHVNRCRSSTVFTLSYFIWSYLILSFSFCFILPYLFLFYLILSNLI